VATVTSTVAAVERDEERAPVCDLDAEAAVISCVVVAPERVTSISELRAEHFSSEAHSVIYAACLALRDDGRPIDVVTLAAYLKDRRYLARAGGTEYLTAVLNAAPSVGAVKTYAGIIVDRWRSREITKILRLATARAEAGNDPLEVANSVRLELGRIQASTTEAKPGLTIWSAEEIWKPIEAPDYLVEGLFVRGSLGLIIAYGASLKTWTLEDAALSVSMGAPWLDRFPTKQARALIIDFESGSYELRRRAHRIANGRGFTIPVEAFAFASMPALSLADDAFFEALRPLAAAYSFIGIDSLAAGSGGINENDARFATPLNRLKALAEETRCVIVLLHHSRKGGGEDADPRELVRGSSAIFNAADVVLQMVRAKDDSAFAVHQTKARGGKAVDPFIVRVNDTGPDGSVVVARNMPEPGADDVERFAGGIDKAKRAILLLLGQEHDVHSANEVCRRVGGRRKTATDGLRELLERGTVVHYKGALRLASDVNQ
jgi:hypothetical protein